MSETSGHVLQDPVDAERDHIRGAIGRGRSLVVFYADFLCPYCRRLRPLLAHLRESLGEQFVYIFRHFPNEQAHPGASLMALGAEAAGRQDRFWEMHDALFAHPLPLDRERLIDVAKSLGLDLKRFERDLEASDLLDRVEEDLVGGRRSGVTATPTIFVDGLRYDGAWDFYSLLEAIERPLGAQVNHTARAFANLPASAGIALLAAAVAALVMANSPLAPVYRAFVDAPFGIGPPHGLLSLSVAEWCSEGLLSVFFMILGLEIRRETRGGSFSDWRSAVSPLAAALGGAVVSAVSYLAFNVGAAATGWPVLIDSGIAFTLGVLAIFGARASPGLKLFVATYGIATDLLTLIVFALFHPRGVHAAWLGGALVILMTMAVLNRSRVYAVWPYLAATIALWVALHSAGVGGAISGIALAAFIPPRPVPRAGPLLAQAATALAELEHVERELEKGARLDQTPIWDWASRNLSAASARLLSPSERVERAVEPWSSYAALPLFAFTATGVPLAADLSIGDSGRVFAGVALGLAFAKPAGIMGALWLAERMKLAVAPTDAGPFAMLGAAFLCAIGDPLSLLMARQALADEHLAAAAEMGVLAGSAIATAFGAMLLVFSTPVGSEGPQDSLDTC